MTDDYHPFRFDIPNLQTQTTDDFHRIERGGFGSLQFGYLLQDLRHPDSVVGTELGAQDLFKGRHFGKVFDFEIFFKRNILTLFQPVCVVVFSRW